MEPKICPIIGEYVCVNFVAQQWCNLLKLHLIVALSAYNWKWVWWAPFLLLNGNKHDKMQMFMKCKKFCGDDSEPS